MNGGRSGMEYGGIQWWTFYRGRKCFCYTIAVRPPIIIVFKASSKFVFVEIASLHYFGVISIT